MLAFSGLVADQSTVLKGKIIDSKTKEPLIGANVIVVGTGKDHNKSETIFFLI